MATPKHTKSSEIITLLCKHESCQEKLIFFKPHNYTLATSVAKNEREEWYITDFEL